MPLEKKAKETLESLLEMSIKDFDEMSTVWEEFDLEFPFNIKHSNDFFVGYVFGKIEHKFVSWFYSEFGRSQTDEEYKEFCNIVKNRLEKIEKK